MRPEVVPAPLRAGLYNQKMASINFRFYYTAHFFVVTVVSFLLPWITTFAAAMAACKPFAFAPF
jgi:hypothetical protein